MNAASVERRPRVSVIIPARNEAAKIRDALATLPHHLREVPIVGGGYKDTTVEAARELRPDVCVVRQAETGEGDVLATGLTECTGDVVVMLDTGGATDGAELSRLVDALIAGAAPAKGAHVVA
jgi:glycosyltransferase involved in cell wall biosynthesis